MSHGAGNVEQQLGNPNRRAIFIPAVPGSGTSCVAGILERLGVSMGHKTPARWLTSRGYYMHEDNAFKFFSTNYTPDETGQLFDPVAASHLRIRDYINYRFIEEPNTRVGFKGPAHWWFDDPNPAFLPLEVLYVVRPLEHSIVGDYGTNHRREERNEEAPGIPTALQDRQRAGSLAFCWMALNQIEDRLTASGQQVAHKVKYYDVVDDPEGEVARIVEAFQLQSTDEQIAAAIASVDPNKRHV